MSDPLDPNASGRVPPYIPRLPMRSRHLGKDLSQLTRSRLRFEKSIKYDSSAFARALPMQLIEMDTSVDVVASRKLINNAATTIQSTWKGYQARKAYNRTKNKGAIDFIAAQTRAFLRAMKKIQKRMLESVGKQIITESEYHDFLRQLKEIRSEYAKLKDEIRPFWLEIPEDNYKEFSRHYMLLVAGLQNKLLTLAEKVGAISLDNLMDLLVPNWYGSSTLLSRVSLNNYRRLFSPTGYTIVDIRRDVDGEYILDDNAGMTFHIPKEHVDAQTPFPTPFRFFSPKNSYEDMYGAEMCYPMPTPGGFLPDKCIVMRGVFKQDPLHLTYYEGSVDLRRSYFEDAILRNPAPQVFKEAFFDAYPTRDFILKDERQFDRALTDGYAKAEALSQRPLAPLSLDFSRLDIKEQVEMLTLLLIGPNPSRGVFVFEMTAKHNAEFSSALKLHLPDTIREKLDFSEQTLRQLREKLKVGGVGDVDLETQIMASGWDDLAKAKAMERYGSSLGSSGDGAKARNWIKGFLKIPVGKFSAQPVQPLAENPTAADRLHHRAEVRKRIEDARVSLESAVQGHEKPKKAFLEMLTQRIRNGESKGTVIGIQGPPGNGKTTLVKKGVAKALGRPYVFISLGSINDGSLISGELYTYVGSIWGKIVQGIMDAGVMDPIIIFDELDKVQNDEKSRQVISSLIHLTDFTQNDEYQDNYFDGVKIDLSRAIFVFSYNDKKLINPVLRDRIMEIETEPLTLKGKFSIAKDYLMPEILEQNGFKVGDITIEDDVVEYIVRNYAPEAGARKLKAKLYSIVRELGLRDYLEDIKYPIRITRELVISCLEKPVYEPEKIASRPYVGMMQGLYAMPGVGGGGILTLQCTRGFSEKRLDLKMTGSLGDMMTESIQVARDLAWNVLPKDIQDEIFREGPFGLHLHATRVGTPKDGPSAGGVITTIMVSQLTNTPIRHNIAATGEVDSFGNLTAIGGLNYKLQGAKEAGVNYVIISRENQKDIDKIMAEDAELVASVRDKREVNPKELNAPVEGIHVIVVDTVQDLLSYALVDNGIPFRSLT